MNFNHERLIVDQEPCKVIFSSEPYPVLLKTGLVVAADVIINKARSKTERSLIISPLSLAKPLVMRINENSNMLCGIEVWIYKSGPDKTATFIVED
jgi:hypothetical protein